ARYRGNGMKDDYLWDGSGETDPEIERLEGLLGRFRSEQPAPELPAAPVVPFRPRRSRILVPFAAAAAVALLSAGVGIWWVQHRAPTIAVIPSTPTTPPPPGPSDTANQISGRPIDQPKVP